MMFRKRPLESRMISKWKLGVLMESTEPMDYIESGEDDPVRSGLYEGMLICHVC